MVNINIQYLNTITHKQQESKVKASVSLCVRVQCVYLVPRPVSIYLTSSVGFAFLGFLATRTSNIFMIMTYS